MDDLKKIRRIISIIVYGLISIVVALIIVRIFLLVIGANRSTPVVQFMYDSSDVFVGMFRGIYPDIIINKGQFIVEIYSIVALFFYVSLAFLISKSIRSVVEADIVQALTNIIDSCFKFLEFVLILRFIFKLTGASVASQFVRALYEISSIIYEPFKGIMPGFSIPSLNSVFETSTIIAIIIIVIFDVVSESIIAHLRKEWEAEKKSNPPKPSSPAPTIVKTVEKEVVQVPTQQPLQAYQTPAPNITINMPQQQPPTQYVDKRTINVVPPLQPVQPSYPYFGANDLEHQRPAANQGLPGQGYYVRPNNEPSASRNANPSSANS